MRIFLLVVLAVLSCSYQLHAQDGAESSPSADMLPTFDSQRSGDFVINDVEVIGIEHFDPEIIIHNAGITRGDVVTLPGNYISDAIRKLWSQGYFSDVQIVIEELENNEINLELYLSERPRVIRWGFEGASKGEISALNQKLGLRSGSELSDFVIKNSVDIITDHYVEKGFRNVVVDIVNENDPIISNGVHITFRIDKGKKVKIGEIIFDGNIELSNKQLESSLKNTKDKHIFNTFKSSKLDEDNYATDKLNLINYYNSRGFRNANIIGDSIYTISERRIGIKIGVEEGNKYYYRNIEWMGNSKYDTHTLNQMVGIRTGDTYDRESLLKRLGVGPDSNPDDISISSLYQNDGHLFFQVEPAETIVGRDSIDIQFKVLEGNQARINEVNISGNQRINDEVIRRDLYVRPGDLYNRSLLMGTLRQLSQMSHFNPEALQPGIVPITNELVNISFPLEEQASDKLELSGGWGSSSFVGSIGVSLNNVSIQNFFKKGAWRPYPSGQNQQLSISGQSNGSYYTALSASFTEPWLGGKKPNSLSVSVTYSDQDYSDYYSYTDDDQYFRSLGVTAGIGRRLKWPDQYFTIYNSLSYQLYHLADWDYFIMEDGYSNIFAFNTVFARNSVDQMIYPRRGSNFSLAIELTPPYSLFDGKDYTDEDMSDQDRYRWVEYHKWEFNSDWYYTLSNNQKLVLKASANFGFLGSYTENKLSPYEGFDVGGDGTSYSVYGVDVVGLRGYESSALNPYSADGDYARAYCKYTLELRYPFVLSASSTIYGLIFAEGGNAYSSATAFDPLNIRRSAGAGVRMYLPIVGMIGMDWGYGFDKATGAADVSGGRIHFTMGMNF